MSRFHTVNMCLASNESLSIGNSLLQELWRGDPEVLEETIQRGMLLRDLQSIRIPADIISWINDQR